MAGRSRVLSLVLPALAVLGGGFAIVSITQTAPKSGLVEPTIMPPTAPGAAEDSFIGAAGLVEAASEQIAIAPQVAGRVARVAVTPGQDVRAGDVLFALDSRDAMATLAAREADLTAAEAKLAEARGKVPSLMATLAAARATEASAVADDQAAKDLVARAPNSMIGTGITERDAFARQFAARAATAKLAAAQAAVAQAAAELALYQAEDGSPGPTVAVAAAGVAQTRAAVDQVRTSLDLLVVRAPIDGTVLQVNTRGGEYAQAAILDTPMVIMGQLTPLHVRVDIDEADIPRFDRHAAATGSPRGDPRRRIPLTFVRVDPIVVPKTSLTGGGTERVDTRVLRVVYAFDPAGTGAFAGEQMDVFITAPPPR